MTGYRYNLALETSSRRGSITLGFDDQILASVELPQQRRHNVDLVPLIDQLFKCHGVAADALGQVYISIGPGSFTGLRIAVATAKMLAYVRLVKLVAVPTLDVIVENAPTDRDDVAVCLNTKRQEMFVGAYRRRCDGWRQYLGPALMTADALCLKTARPLVVMGHHLPDFDWPFGVEVLGGELSVPRSVEVWRLGRAGARQGRFIDPVGLVPLYARRPEAESLWKQRRE